MDLSWFFNIFNQLLQMFGISGTPHLNTFNVLFGGGFMFAGLLMMLFAAISAIRVLMAQNWPTAEGRVLGSHIASSHSSEGGTSYRAVIQYQYQVGERTYQSDLLSFGSRNMYAGYGGAQRALQRYPVGAAVRVHYNPNKPERGVLEVRTASGCLLTGMGVLFSIIGVAGCVLGAYLPF